MKRKLITSALPYINNVPHLGNLIQVLSADAFARFCRLRGYDTLYVCGTDEYGTATETRAAVEGISPRELCDRYYSIHAGIYEWFHIAFDKFGRTSTPIQTEIVQEIFRKLDAGGYIAERTIEQLYCGSCGRFLADRYVRGTCPHCGYAEARGDQCEACGKLLDPTDLKEPRCSSCGSAPSVKPTKHLYIDLPKLKDRLEAWIGEASVKGAWANNALRMTEAWIRDGLRERAITRDLKWGIPVPKPGYENKVFYVWFDAPIGYISITGNLGAETTGDWRKFVDSWWKNPGEVELFQFIGKDNIPFHTVIFPSSLLGTGDKWTMLHHMSSTEYLNYESGKFSKSKGIGVFGTDVMETGIDADVWRFYIFYNRPEKADALFTWKDFQEKVNGELIGNLGNLVNRTLSFVTRYYGGTIPGRGASRSPELSAFREAVKKMEEDITARLEKSELRDAFRGVFELSSFANKTFQEAEPWRKRTEDPPAAEALIRELCYVVRDIAVMVEPFMPAAARRIASFFGLAIGNKIDNNVEPVPKSQPISEEGARDRRSHAPYGRATVPAYPLCGALPRNAPPGGFNPPGPPGFETGSIDNKIEGDGGTLSWAVLGRDGGLPGSITSRVLFSRLEDDQVDALRERYSGSQQDRAERRADKPVADKPAVTEPVPAGFADTLDLRAAQIIRIERHPKADKLYIETLEIAGEERVIVSGLVPFYKEEELLNRKIIVAYNLKPAKLRGVESRGMLLAASCKGEDGAERVEVLDAGDVPTGTRVALEGEEPGNTPAEIDIDAFCSVPLLVRDYTVESGGKTLALGGKPVRTRTIAAGEVH